MKYKRLTERDERGFPCIKGVSPENLYKGIDDMNEAVSVTWAVKRLAELEDKIERGELISTVQAEQGEQEIAFFVEHNAEVRKQAVKEFAERVKMAFYYEFDELIPSTMADKIDALVKEKCGKEKILIDALISAGHISKQARTAIEKLKAENAELRARLEKAVELPCKLGDTTVYAIECYSCGYYMREYCAAEIAVTEDGEFAFYSPEIPARRLIFGKDIFTSKEAAEARLKEIKENNNG